MMKRFAKTKERWRIEEKRSKKEGKGRKLRKVFFRMQLVEVRDVGKISRCPGMGFKGN